MQLEVNAVEEEEEEEEEPISIQGVSSIISGTINEPEHVDGAYVIPVYELSDTGSSVNQPIPAAPIAYNMMLFPEEMLGQVTEAARHHGVDIDRVFTFYPPPRQ